MIEGSLSVQKLLKKETAVESAGIILFFLIIERIIQTFRGIIFARVLGPGEYGLFTLAIFFIPIVVTLAKLGIPSCYNRYVPQYEEKGMLGDFFIRNYRITILAGIFFTVLCLSFSKQISWLLFASVDHKFIIVLCALTILPSLIFENLQFSFSGMRIYKMGSLLRFAQFFIFTALSIPLVIYYQKVEYAVTANLISFIIVSSLFAFITLKYILRSGSQSVKIEDNNFYRKIFRYSVWFVVTPIIVNVFNYMDRLMLNRFLGLEEVGIYSIAVNVANLLLLFGMVAGKVVMPNLSRIWENGEKERVISLFNIGIKANALVILFIAVMLSLFKEPLVSFLYGQSYIESISAINILLIFSFFTSIHAIIGAYAGIIEKTFIHLIINIIGFVFNVILNYILIPNYQLVGAATATTVSFIISFIAINCWFYKEGLKLSFVTVFLYFTPIVLILNSTLMSIIFLILMVVTIRSNLIISNNEKIILKQQLVKAIESKKARKYTNDLK